MGETKGKTLNSKSVVKFVSDHAIIFLIILLAIITWANSQNLLSADNVGNLISNVAPRFIRLPDHQGHGPVGGPPGGPGRLLCRHDAADPGLQRPGV